MADVIMGLDTAYDSCFLPDQQNSRLSTNTVFIMGDFRRVFEFYGVAVKLNI